MQYSLKKPENVVIPLPGGKFVSRPINTPVLDAARAVAQRQAREARENPGIVRELGIMGEIEAKDADAVHDVLFQCFLRIELGIQLIESWEGFGDDTAADVNADNVRLAFTHHPSVGKIFYEKLMTAYLEQVFVKKNSAPAANGTSAAEASTAKTAGT